MDKKTTKEITVDESTISAITDTLLDLDPSFKSRPKELDDVATSIFRTLYSCYDQGFKAGSEKGFAIGVILTVGSLAAGVGLGMLMEWLKTKHINKFFNIK